MSVFDFIRFKKRPPEKNPPPKNYIDMRYDNDSSGFVLVDDSGAKTPIGGEGSILYDADYEAVNTGLSDSLDSIPTVDLDVGVIRCVSFLSFSYTYKLLAGTDAADGIYVVRPTDYADTTNEKVWKLLSPVSDQGLSRSLALATGNPLTTATIEATTQVTAERTFQLPNASGTIVAVPTYADETAANAAEDANVVYWNTATGKAQVTTA